MLHHIEWEQRSLDNNATPSFGIDDSVLVICEKQGGFGHELVEVLKQHNSSNKILSVVHSEAENVVAVLREDVWNNKLPALIVYAVDDEPTTDVTGLSMNYSSVVLAVVQTIVSLRDELLRENKKWEPRIVLTTKLATWVGNFNSVEHHSKAAVWGLGAALCLEHPEMMCRRIDFDNETNVYTIATEIAQDKKTKEDQVGFRNGVRYVARVASFPKPIVNPFVCNPNGIYVVTGGYGGIGIKTIDMLITMGAKRIAVISRKGEPTQGEGAESLTRWRAAGIVVISCVADVANYTQLKEVLSSFEWPVKGILHSAGVTNDAAMVKSDVTKFESVFAPKITGAWNLHLLTQDLSLDFFVLFSSIASLLGNAGQSSYAAGNYFMDSLAHHRRKVGLPALSINWGAWAEVGVAATQKKLLEKLAQKGIIAFAPDKGISALATLVAAGLDSPPSIAVLGVKWDTYLLQYNGKVPAYFARVRKADPTTKKRSAQKRTGNASSALAKLQGLTGNALVDALQNYLQAEIATAIGVSISDVEPGTNFTELGVDSLMATQLRNTFSSDLQSMLSSTLLFDHTSLGALTEFLLPIVETQLIGQGKEEEEEEEDELQDRVSVQTRTLDKLTVEEFPLTNAQQGLWFLWKLYPASAAYNVVWCARIEGRNVQPALLAESWDEVVLRHPLMRTNVVEKTGLPTHKIHTPEVSPKFLLDSRMYLDDAELTEAIDQISTRPFDLAQDPLYRASLHTKVTNNEYVVLVCAHHIVTDYASLEIIMEEVFALYEGKVRRSVVELPSPASNFEEYVNYQKLLLDSKGDELWKYWRNQLNGGIPQLSFAFARKHSNDEALERSTDSGPIGASYHFQLGAPLFSALRSVSGSLAVTLFHTLNAAFQILLMKYTNQTDIMVGIFTSSRQKAEFEKIVGYCLNTIVVRSELSGDPTFKQVATAVSKNMRDGLAHQDYPFPLLMEKLSREFSPSKANLQVSMNFLQASMFEGQEDSSAEEKSVHLSRFFVEQQEGQFDLSLEVVGNPTLSSVIKYNSLLFSEDHIQQMAEHYRTILTNLCSNPNVPISEIDYMPQRELDTVLYEWNNTLRDYPWEVTAADIVDKQCAEHPNNVALKFGDNQLTYSQLSSKINPLATLLNSLGVVPNTIVGVHLERSMELMISVLAVFKSGGVYLPLDPDYPANRLDYILTDSRTRFLITTKSLHASLLRNSPQLADQLHVIFIDDKIPVVTSTTALKPRSSDMAYVMYTSGSTGNPKGVMLPHKALTNLLHWVMDEYELLPTDCVLMKTSICFDVSIFEMFWPFCFGASLFISRQGGQLDADYMINVINKAQVTALHFVPSHLQVLVDHPMFEVSTQKVHTVILIGESVPHNLHAKLGKKLHNLYGPTETTVLSTFFRCDEGNAANIYKGAKTVPIGRPIANTNIYILDQHMKPVPQGVAGELYIGGAGVALGYLQREELTRQKFVRDPFSKNEGDLMFKTGDYGAFLEGGDIELFGRLDNQVKLRGFRIELGEVEATILRHHAIKEALAVVFHDTLVAYVIAKPQAKVNDIPTTLRDFLTQSTALPSYMVPTHIVIMKEFPLLPNGKANRKELPSPFASAPIVQNPQTHGSSYEAQIATLWQQLGLVVNPSNKTQTFHEAGGSSLTAMKFLFLFKETFQVQLPVAEFFNKPTIADLANYLAKSSNPQTITPGLAMNVPKSSKAASRDIAIVGLGCRFPNGESLDKMWFSLLNGTDSVQAATLVNYAGQQYETMGGFIPEIDQFDPQFFGVTRDAITMDPQQRLLLEVTYEALENAGIPTNSMENTRTGVFVGISSHEYFDMLIENGIDASELPRVGTGNFISAAAGRLSYTFGFKGPAMSIDTACSSSLVAIHLACQSLIAGETDAAVAGGVNALLSEKPFIFLDKAGMLSEDGRCKTFDVRANGYTRAEGCGIVVLKRLEDAIASKDNIMAVIKGSAVNQDGKTRNMTTPNGDSQRDVMHDALSAGGIEASDVSYLEAHGTGTALGDPIEIESILKVLCPPTRTEPLVVGSVKTNIGHAEAAAGVAGLIKVVLAMNNNTIPQHLHLTALNPHLPDIEGRIKLPSEGPMEWNAKSVRTAGVSSFGFSGTNAHAVIQSFTQPVANSYKNIPEAVHVLPISAKSAVALRALCIKFRDYLQNSSTRLCDISHTCMVGRNHYSHRLALVGSTTEQLLNKIEDYLQQNPTSYSTKYNQTTQQPITPNFIWLFGGEEYEAGFEYGQKRIVSAFVSCLSELQKDNKEAALEICKDIAHHYIGVEIDTFCEVFLECAETYNSITTIHGDTHLSEMALFVFQVAQGKTWKKLGMSTASPSVVYGVGEYAAACVLGSMQMQDALRALHTRRERVIANDSFKLYEEMIVFAPLSDVQNTIQRLPECDLTVVAINGEANIALVGPPKSVALLDATMKEANIFVQKLPHPRIHSLLQCLPGAPMAINIPKLAEILVENTNSTPIVVLDHGIGSATSAYIRRSLRTLSPTKKIDVSVILSRRNTSTAILHLQQTVAKLYAAGYDINWAEYDSNIYRKTEVSKVQVPTYAFQRQTYWYNSKPFRLLRTADVATKQQQIEPAATDMVPENNTSSKEGKITLNDIIAHLRRILKLDNSVYIDPEAQLVTMGLDSLMVLELRDALQVDTGLQLPSTLAYDAITVGGLVNFVENMRGANLLSTVAPKIQQPATIFGTNNPQGPIREQIAIVGMACKFPGGVSSPQSFWEILKEGVDTVAEIPTSRWDVDKYYGERVDPGKMYTRNGSFMDNIDMFDAEFFNITPREAILMDPQQRILLETTWEGIENAGCNPQQLVNSKTGVFIGISQNDYAALQMQSGLYAELDSPYAGSGSAISVAAGRVSHFFGFQGPAMSVDTACSSSLVAIHLACKSLLSHESNMAVAGGVNVILLPDLNVQMCKAGMLSPDGRCKTFSSTADGYGRAEGCGLVVLKRLSDALENKDNILAVIKATNVNQDGRSSGLTVPNKYAQQSLMSAALATAGVSGDQIQYLEAHGTGTPLGDPIEVNSVLDVMCPKTRTKPLVVGSVKTNIGHAEAAAGVAGLIKTVLSMNHQTIPRHLHVAEFNTHLPNFEGRLEIPYKAATSWASTKKLAAVNSFGFSGTNANVILEDFLQTSSSTTQETYCFVPLSAKTDIALRALAGKFREFLEKSNPVDLPSISNSCISGRAHFSHRLSLKGSTIDQMLNSIDQFLSGEQTRPRPQPQVVFVFGDLGSANVADSNCFGKTFHDTFANCSNLISKHKSVSNPQLQARALYFAQQVALAAMWQTWGINPSMCVGCGIVGEYAAAYTVGVITLQDAISMLLSTNPQKLARVQHSGIKLLFTETDGSKLVHEITSECEAPADIMQFAPVVQVGAILSCPVIESVVNALAVLYENGAMFDGAALATQLLPNSRKIILPNYQFQRKKHWFEVPKHTIVNTPDVPENRQHTQLLKQLDVPSHFYYNGVVDVSAFISDGKSIPTGLLVAAIKEAWHLYTNDKSNPVRVDNLSFRTLDSEFTASEMNIHIELIPNPSQTTFQLSIKTLKQWEVYATGQVQSSDMPPSSQVNMIAFSPLAKNSVFAKELPYLSDVCSSNKNKDIVATVNTSLFGKTVHQYVAGCLQANIGLISFVVSDNDDSNMYMTRIRDIQSMIVGSTIDPSVVTCRLSMKDEFKGLNDDGKCTITVDAFVCDTSNSVVLAAENIVVEIYSHNYAAQLEATSLYTTYWHPQPLPPYNNADNSWIVFAPASQNFVANLLPQLGPCTLVYAEKAPLTSNPSAISMNNAIEVNDFINVLKSVGNIPTGILFMWPLDITINENDTVNLEQKQDFLLNRTLNLVKALASISAWAANPPSLWFITQGAVGEIPSKRAINPLHSTLWGFGRVITVEHPAFCCRMVDLATNLSNSEESFGTAVALAKEMKASLSIPKNHSKEVHLVLTQSDRYVMRLQRAKTKSDVPLTSTISKNGTYVITGGLGTLGLKIAQWIASKGAKNIILTSRSASVPTYALSTLAELQLLANVIVHQLDLESLHDVQNFINNTDNLVGIIHCAGFVEDGVIVNQSWSQFKSVLGPKVIGSWNLHIATRNIKSLNMFVMFSSSAAVVGAIAQSNYAAANSFMDALAMYRRESGLPAQSLAWSIWANSMGAKAKNKQLILRLYDWIFPKQGIELLDLVLGGNVVGDPASLAVLNANWEGFRGMYNTRGEDVPLLLSNFAIRASSLSTKTKPGESTEKVLADILVDVLMLESIGEDQNFTEVGLDSMSGYFLCSNIEKVFNVKLDFHVLLSAQTVRELAKVVEYQILIGNVNSEQIVEGHSHVPELVPIQKGTSRHTLFFIHPIGGTVYFYKNIACHLEGQSVYGIQAQGLIEGMHPQTDVSAMAKRYIECVKTVQTNGPYYLAGMSFGGTVAYEMAQQLASAGETVAFLALIDTPNQTDIREAPFTEDEILQRSIQYIFGDKFTVPEMSAHHDIDAKLEYLQSTGKITNSVDPNYLRRFISVWSANNRAMQGYIPKPYSGKLVYFAAEEKVSYYPATDHVEWGELAAHFESYIVPGNHVTLIAEPHVTELAYKISKYLDMW